MDPAQRTPKLSGSSDHRPPTDKEPDGFAWKGALAVGLTVAGLVVWRACSKPEGPVGNPPAPPASDDPDLAALGGGVPEESAALPARSTDAAADTPPRCAQLAAEAFMIGEASREQRKPDGAGGGDGDNADELAPFAVEVGRGATYSGGFAIGAQRESEGGTVAMVATLAADGTQGKLVRLARSRGDMDPPVVAGAGGAILAAMLEPNAGGRAIKIAKVEGDHVTWGAELSEGRDESLALDIAVSGPRALIVWDDVTRDGKRSQIMLSSIDAGSLRSVTSPRPVSHPNTDAEMPRIIARPGGYWLAYVARADEVTPGRAGAAKKSNDDDNEDTAAAGETITHQWLEVAPLDETGTPTATPRAITPKDGHVLAFDLTLSQDDGVIIALRDDDTPSGSSGGRVSAALVRLSGAVELRVLAGGEHTAATDAEQGLGAGVPALVPGTWASGAGSAPAYPAWLAIANAAGATQIASLSPVGDLVDDLRAEPALGRGEPVAALANNLLVARPAGKAMKLVVLRCITAPLPPK